MTETLLKDAEGAFCVSGIDHLRFTIWVERSDDSYFERSEADPDIWTPRKGRRACDQHFAWEEIQKTFDLPDVPLQEKPEFFCTRMREGETWRFLSEPMDKKTFCVMDFQGAYFRGFTPSDFDEFRRKLRRFVGLWQDFFDLKINPTRVDLRADFSVEDVPDLYQLHEEAIRTKDDLGRPVGIRSKIRTPDFRVSYNPKKPGETIYLGTRQSERLLRIYNTRAKLAEPVGPIERPVRFELELKGRHAKRAFDAILSEGTTLTPCVLGHLAEAVTFVDVETCRGVNRGRKRVSEAPWWARLIVAKEALGPLIKKEMISAQRKVEAFIQQVGKRAAKLKDAVGDRVDFISAAVAYGRQRYTDRDVSQVLCMKHELARVLPERGAILPQFGPS